MRSTTMKINRLGCTLLIIAVSWAVGPSPAHAQAIADFLRTNPKFVQNFREVVAGPSPEGGASFTVSLPYSAHEPVPVDDR